MGVPTEMASRIYCTRTCHLDKWIISQDPRRIDAVKAVVDCETDIIDRPIVSDIRLLPYDPDKNKLQLPLPIVGRTYILVYFDDSVCRYQLQRVSHNPDSLLKYSLDDKPPVKIYDMGRYSSDRFSYYFYYLDDFHVYRSSEIYLAYVI